MSTKRRVRKKRAPIPIRNSSMELAVEVVIHGGRGTETHVDWIFDDPEKASLSAFARAMGDTVRRSIIDHMKKGDYVYTLTLRMGQTWGQDHEPGDPR